VPLSPAVPWADACARIDVVTMALWDGYIGPVNARTNAAVVFDKFHIAQHLGRAVDAVRRAEQRQLLAVGVQRLTGTRYVWLRSASKMRGAGRREFGALRRSNLKVARAWALKESAMSLWGYRSRGWAIRMWRRWYAVGGAHLNQPLRLQYFQRFADGAFAHAERAD